MVDLKKHLTNELSDILFEKLNQINQYKNPRTVANLIASILIDSVELIDDVVVKNSLENVNVNISKKEIWELCCQYLIAAKCIETELDLHFSEELKDYQSETNYSVLQFKKVQ